MVLTSKERFINSVFFKEIDNAFRWEAAGFWPTTLEKWKKQGLPEYVGYENIMDCLFKIDGENINSYFNMDNIKFIPVESGWVGIPFHPYFEEKIIQRVGNNIIKLEKDGIIKKIKEVNPETSMPQFLKYPVKDIDDFNRLKFRLDPNSKERLPFNWSNLVNSYKKRDYPLGIFICGSYGFPRNLMGDENLMYSIFDNQQLIINILENWLELYQGYIEIICRDITPDFVLFWEDMAYKNASLISPFHYQKLMVPYLKKLIEFVKNKGIKIIIVDSDGNISELIPIFVDAGINAMFPFEAQADMDIVKIRKKYESSFAIIGGIDKKALLDTTVLEAEIERIVPYMLESGGYIPSLDHSVPHDINLDDFRYYLGLVREIK